MKIPRKRITVWVLAPLLLMGLSGAINYVRGTENEPLKEPVRSVLENYQRIQKALAADSMTEVAEGARTIAKAIRDDEGKSLPLTVATEAENLADAQDINAARRAFKPLSASLIAWLAESQVESSGYREAYCPMVDASWLQKEAEINNPYYGTRMLRCGEFDRRF